MNNILPRLLGSLCILFQSSFSSAMEVEDLVDLSLRSGWRASDMTHIAAFEITLKPGWKTYWRQPGSTGITPIFEMQSQVDLTHVDIKWPTPELIENDFSYDIGYHDRVILPFELTLSEAADKFEVSGHVQIGICKDVCIPAKLYFSKMLTNSSKRDPQIISALIDQPQSASDLGLESPKCTHIQTEDKGAHLTLAFPDSSLKALTYITIENPQQETWTTPPEISKQNGTLTASLDMYQSERRPLELAHEALIITAFTSEDVIEFRGCRE